MNQTPAFPSNLFNPSFDEVEQDADTAGVILAKDTDFLFKCWRTFHVQSNYAGDHSVPRLRNLFWRTWSNPHLTVPNHSFNSLWQECRTPSFQTTFEPDHRHRIWQQVAKLGEGTKQAQPKEEPSSLPSSIEPLPTPESPTATKITFAEESCAEGTRTRRDRTSSGAGGTTSSRPTVRRTGSGRVASTTAGRGGRARPALMRSRSSQNRQPGTRTNENATASTGVSSSRNPTRKPGVNFEMPSDDDGEWEEDANDEAQGAKEAKSSTGEASSTSNNTLVDSNFRKQFETARQMSSGTSFTAASYLPKIRSSVRFVDETEDPTGSLKGKAREMERGSRQRADSSAVADSDDSDETQTGLPRNQSNLSTLIKNKRQQSGSNNIGPSPPEDAKRIEARKKEEELLRQGREAAKPIIPRSRRPSAERPDGAYQGPPPGATF